MKLERIISNRGGGSRKEVELLLRYGRVTVNGQLVKSGALKFPTNVDIWLKGQPLLPTPLLAAYYKPVGMHSVMKDPWNRPCLGRLSEQFPFLKQMHPVGRLDADTSGLLLFSSDGKLTESLLHPKHCIPRRYLALVEEAVDFNVLRDKLRGGVATTEGVMAGTLEFAYALDGSEDPRLGEVLDGVNAEHQKRMEKSTNVPQAKGNQIPVTSLSLVGLTVTEGKYRMVRRMLHNCGHSVVFLMRYQFGEIGLYPLNQISPFGYSDDSDFASRIGLGLAELLSNNYSNYNGLNAGTIVEGRNNFVDVDRTSDDLSDIRTTSTSELLQIGDVRPCSKEEEYWASSLLSNHHKFKKQ